MSLSDGRRFIGSSRRRRSGRRGAAVMRGADASKLETVRVKTVERCTAAAAASGGSAFRLSPSGPGQHVNPGRKRGRSAGLPVATGHDRRRRRRDAQSTLNALKVARARRGLLEEWNYVESTAQGLSPAAVNGGGRCARVGALSRAMTGRCDDDWKAEKPAAAVMKAQRAAAKRILEYRRRGASSSIERGIGPEAAAAFATTTTAPARAARRPAAAARRPVGSGAGGAPPTSRP